MITLASVGHRADPRATTTLSHASLRRMRARGATRELRSHPRCTHMHMIYLNKHRHLPTHHVYSVHHCAKQRFTIGSWVLRCGPEADWACRSSPLQPAGKIGPPQTYSMRGDHRPKVGRQNRINSYHAGWAGGRKFKAALDGVSTLSGIQVGPMLNEFKYSVTSDWVMTWTACS